MLLSVLVKFRVSYNVNSEFQFITMLLEATDDKLVSFPNSILPRPTPYSAEFNCILKKLSDFLFAEA